MLYRSSHSPCVRVTKVNLLHFVLSPFLSFPLLPFPFFSFLSFLFHFSFSSSFLSIPLPLFSFPSISFLPLLYFSFHFFPSLSSVLHLIPLFLKFAPLLCFLFLIPHYRKPPFFLQKSRHEDVPREPVHWWRQCSCSTHPTSSGASVSADLRTRRSNENMFIKVSINPKLKIQSREKALQSR